MKKFFLSILIGILAMSSVATTTFYTYDGNNNVVSLVNTSGQTPGKYTYDPYGNTISKTGTMSDINTYRFSSKEIQPVSGLYAYKYRFYNPTDHRWINSDPIGLSGGRNVYVFVGNDPINGYDLYGLAPEMVLDNRSSNPEIQMAMAMATSGAIGALNAMGQEQDREINNLAGSISEYTGAPSAPIAHALNYMAFMGMPETGGGMNLATRESMLLRDAFSDLNEIASSRKLKCIHAGGGLPFPPDKYRSLSPESKAALHNLTSDDILRTQQIRDALSSFGATDAMLPENMDNVVYNINFGEDYYLLPQEQRESDITIFHYIAGTAGGQNPKFPTIHISPIPRAQQISALENSPTRILFNTGWGFPGPEGSSVEFQQLPQNIRNFDFIGKIDPTGTRGCGVWTRWP